MTAITIAGYHGGTLLEIGGIFVGAFTILGRQQARIRRERCRYVRRVER